jgi:hypothetical protein
MDTGRTVYRVQGADKSVWLFHRHVGIVVYTDPVYGRRERVIKAI